MSFFALNFARSGALRPTISCPAFSFAGSGALRPPPPVAAPLVPRCALPPAATPRLIRARVALMPSRLSPTSVLAMDVRQGRHATAD